MLSGAGVQDPVVRDLMAAELRRPMVVPSEDGSALATGDGAADKVASVPMVPPVPPRAVPVSAALIKNRDSVRLLQVKGNLAGVPIHTSGGEFVPLLPMAARLNWEQALDEYAEAVGGRAAVVKVQQLSGNRWRLRHPDRERGRLIKLYSERAALHRAFDKEYARRGTTVGIARVVSSLKQRYATGANTKAVLAVLRKDYPPANARERLTGPGSTYI